MTDNRATTTHIPLRGLLMNRPKFTVDSIRPDSLKKLQKYAKEADLEWLSTKFDSFVEGHCPICGGDSDSKIIYNIGNKLHYNICNDCNTLFFRDTTRQKCI